MSKTLAVDGILKTQSLVNFQLVHSKTWFFYSLFVLRHASNGLRWNACTCRPLALNFLLLCCAAAAVMLEAMEFHGQPLFSNEISPFFLNLGRAKRNFATHKREKYLRKTSRFQNTEVNEPRHWMHVLLCPTIIFIAVYLGLLYTLLWYSLLVFWQKYYRLRCSQS